MNKINKKLDLLLISLRSLDPYVLIFRKNSLQSNNLTISLPEKKANDLLFQIQQLKLQASYYSCDLMYKQDNTKVDLYFLNKYLKNFTLAFDSNKKDLNNYLHFNFAFEKDKKVKKDLLPLLGLTSLEDYFSI